MSYSGVVVGSLAAWGSYLYIKVGTASDMSVAVPTLGLETCLSYVYAEEAAILGCQPGLQLSSISGACRERCIVAAHRQVHRNRH
jgi:hypothetical protein